MDKLTVPLDPASVTPTAARSVYPAPFDARMAGREKRVLGEAFGLANFGVVHVTLAPGASSALRHSHSKQDEFVIGMAGTLTVIVGEARHPLPPGHVIGFPAGGEAHRIVNETDAPGAFIVAGDRTAGDDVTYPDDDIEAHDVDGEWVFTRKDGTAY